MKRGIVSDVYYDLEGRNPRLWRLLPGVCPYRDAAWTFLAR
jgi:hypothetical protein